MAQFRYLAVDGAGRRTRGVLDANNRAAATEALTTEGLSPLDVQEATPSQSTQSKGGRIGHRSALVLVTELAQLMENHTPLDKALRVVSEAAPDRAARAVADRLRLRLRESGSLATALAEEQARSDAFPPHTAGLARAGEASGNLGGALARLAEDMDRAASTRRAIWGALAYPAIVTIVALLAMAALFLFVVPQFERLFGSQGARASEEAQMLIQVSRWVRTWGGVALISTIGGAVILAQISRTPIIRGLLREIWLRVPWFGGMAAKREVARWCHVTAALLHGGATLSETLKISEEACATPSLRRGARRAARDVERGEALSDGLAKAPHWPQTPAQYARVGEETRSLGPMLSTAGKLLEAEADAALRVAATAIGPIVILLLGALIGTFVAMMFSAIISVNDLAI